MTARLIMKLRVETAVAVTPDVLHVTLVHPIRPELPAWTPGAHVDLRLPDGRIRQYSLCGDSRDLSRYEIAVKREPGGRGGSQWVHENLRPGAIAHVSAPRGSFPPAAAAEHVFVAGGIGVTPFAAMARALAAEGVPFHLHFCARSPAEAPLLETLREICGPRLTTWFSAQGNRFTPSTLGAPRPGVHLYACGPQSLVDAMDAELARQGWPEAQIHIERFQASLDENFKPEPFEARIASTGAVLHVPADRSLLEVLRDHDIALPASCELGVCGSCECGFTAGVVIHRDAVLPLSKRQDRMTPCVSRARVEVTLAL